MLHNQSVKLLKKFDTYIDGLITKKISDSVLLVKSVIEDDYLAEPTTWYVFTREEQGSVIENDETLIEDHQTEEDGLPNGTLTASSPMPCSDEVAGENHETMQPATSDESPTSDRSA
ncbi:unnamed protein product [Soboliphyme baturini]|uniref:Gag-pol polyprotein n=1 Tax=Soboliphyme baturini TaxID=241478 RepID=A0A183IRY5_9BILA|nr:unnamed protein product [Soboliphyme baturini]